MQLDIAGGSRLRTARRKLRARAGSRAAHRILHERLPGRGYLCRQQVLASREPARVSQGHNVGIRTYQACGRFRCRFRYCTGTSFECCCLWFMCCKKKKFQLVKAIMWASGPIKHVAASDADSNTAHVQSLNAAVIGSSVVKRCV